MEQREQRVSSLTLCRVVTEEDVVKEGWYKWWTPQVVLGLDDPLSHTRNGGGNIEFKDDAMWDNHFTRYYLAATKHLDFEGVGRLGVHAAWIMNYGAGGTASNPNRFNRPSAGASFRLDLPMTLAADGKDWWVRALNGIEALAEYDARTVNRRTKQEQKQCLH